MSETAVRWSPEQVAALTDVELSAHVAVRCGIKVHAGGIKGREYLDIVGKQARLHPDCGDAVVHVLEHMRRLWFDSEPDPFVRLNWSLYTGRVGWVVEAERVADAEGDPFVSVRNARVGRAVFECALLTSEAP